MVDAINADRARLAEVQDRIIQLDSLRRELDHRTAPSEEYVHLGEEGLTLHKEETALRRALEDAGVPAPTTADHAREKLAAIRSRRAEISTADQKARVFEDLDGEEESLTAEERDLAAYLEAIDAAEDDPPGKEQPTGDGEPAPPAPPEDEEVGSFTLGKCNYCGREWGVTLEGAKGGGYPTQKTANAAATRVCDCPEAVENRKPEIHGDLSLSHYFEYQRVDSVLCPPWPAENEKKRPRRPPCWVVSGAAVVSGPLWVTRGRQALNAGPLSSG